MFTGIIESVGRIVAREQQETNMSLTISSDISASLKIDQSVSHNGVCLTVVKVYEDTHTVTLINETLNKTNFSQCTVGDMINLERCMQMNGRLDGHIVQGHVDAIAICLSKKDNHGSWNYVFKIDPAFATLVIEKGSVCIQGVSLTCFHVASDTFEVSIIPYTYDHTNFKNIEPGSIVNIEFDVIGKYIQRIHSLTNSAKN